MSGVRPAAGAVFFLAAVVAASSEAAAQSAGARTVSVPFAGAVSQDGYASASMSVTYAFITCQGEMHIAYSLNEGSATTGGSYRFQGKTYPAAGAPPQPMSIRFAGTVYRGPAVVGSFNDGLAGRALGMGCFTGQSQKIANIADVVGPKATADQIVAYYNSLRVQVLPGNVLRSASVESAIRGDIRRAEAEAAAAKRKAEQEQQARVQQEAGQKAAAERQQQLAQAASAAARPPGGGVSSAGSPAPAAPVQAARPPPSLSDAERIAKGIASDKVLADQRLQEQRRVYAEQQAQLAAQQQRQTEALIAAAPAMMDLAGGIYGAIEGFDARWKARTYLEAQRKLAGKCALPNGMAAPKDGEIQLGVEITAKLTKADCGDNPTNRYKAFLLEVPETTRLRFTIRPAAWRIFTSFQINVRDLDKNSHMFLGWQEWGAIQKVNNKSVTLQPGLYTVTVFNGVQDIFADFKLRVDAIGPDGQVIATAPRPAAAPSPPAGRR